MKKILCVLLMATTIIGFAGCSGGGNNSDPNRGFDLEIYAVSPFNGVRIQTGARLQGQLLASNSQTTGTIDNFTQDINGVGLTRITGAKAPGTWRFTYPVSPIVPTLCLGITVADRNVSRGQLVPLDCQGRAFFAFSASPDVIEYENPPTSLTLSGDGMENVQGNPAIALYDSQGTFISSTVPNSYIWNGTELEGVVVSLSDLSQAYNGIYTITVNNVNSDGSWDLVGAANISVFGYPPPPPPDGGDPCDPNSPYNGENPQLEQPVEPCYQY